MFLQKIKPFNKLLTQLTSRYMLFMLIEKSWDDFDEQL